VTQNLNESSELYLKSMQRSLVKFSVKRFNLPLHRLQNVKWSYCRG